MNKKLTEKQIECLAMLTSGLPVHTISQSINVAPKTIYQWLKQPEFKSELKTQAKALLDANLARQIALTNKAFEVLGEILDSGSDRNKLIAIDLILRNIDRYRNY